MITTISRRQFLSQAAGTVAACTLAPQVFGAAPAKRPPHIVFVLVDDMGLGDLACYSDTTQIPTPTFDRVAREGMRFTDAHSSGAVCVPSRYGILTGQYYWRTPNRQLNGYGPNVVELERQTMADLLRGQGYATNYIGKWHLGLGTEEPADFSKPLKPNPTDHGFDYFFGLPASLDMPPYCFVENDHAVTKPTSHTPGSPKFTSGWHREGAIAPDFKLEETLPRLTAKAVERIEGHAAKQAEQPLFLYFAMNGPHTPWFPSGDARAKSQVGDYGDYVYDVDRSLAAVLGALEAAGMVEDTLVVVASDNGGPQLLMPKEYTHQLNMDYHGQKGDIWEGGHRIPLLARWPGRITAGAVNPALFSLTDLCATFTAATGAALTADAGEDSLNQLPALLGKASTPVRTTMVHDCLAKFYGLRDGDWKLITALGGGGLDYKPDQHQPKPGEARGELFNLKEDPHETRNVYAEHPEVVARLTERLAQFKERGERSVLGAS